MNGSVVGIIDFCAIDPGSILKCSNFFLFCIFNLFLFCFLFRIFNLLLFFFHGERSNYIISLTTEPPITQCNKQLQRNGVHANDFNNVFKKNNKKKRKKTILKIQQICQFKPKPSNGFTLGLSQESRYSTILISTNLGQM